ncbi:MAG: hypothetical protein K2X27_27440 [Candidatus Obscuribacterales bacterium]|nr:hypothetical protein [Candidatus Obscuribacterales bacterium]
MSFSEDSSSSAAPFSGDSSGQIFDLPDMVASSPTTSERVLDTQSGFLLVVKKLNERLSLSVKRQIGTPPSSSVSLTPDESLKLSRILESSFSSDDFDSEYPKIGGRRKRGSRLFAKTELESDPELDLKVQAQSLSSVHVPMKLMLGSVLRAFMVPIVGLALSLFLLGIGAGISSYQLFEKKALAPAVIKDPLESKKVDTYVKDFVSKLLDFSPKTYRISQVQAMAAMSPELMERYWQETRFPLTKRQLAAAAQGATIMINQLKQERLDADTVAVDVHAQLCDPANPKLATPVNLRLKLALGADKQIVVVDQQDLSASAR